MNWKKISDIIYDPISGEWGEEGRGIKVIRTTNFTNEGKLNLTDIVSRNVDQKKVEKKRLIYGDIIIEKSGGSPTQPVGRVVYFDVNDSEFICNNFTSVLRLKHNEFDSRYFFWFLFWQHQSKKTLRFQNKTTGIINLQLSRYLDEIKIKSISLKAQKHIAEILDKADALRQQNRQLLTHYDELLQSTFIELFGDPVKNPKGWEVRRLENLILEGPKNGLYKSSNEYGEGYPILRIDSFYNGKVGNITNLKRVKATEKDLKQFQVFENDIVINRVNSKSHLGKCGLIPKLKEITLFESNMMRIKFKKELEPIYTSFILSTDFVKKQILERAKDAVNQSSINQDDVKSFKIPVPPISLQQHFAKIVEQIEVQKEQAKTALEESEALFEGLLAKYFG